MSYWQDPRLGTYKSAVQKYVRRGEIDAAVSAAEALVRVPGGRSALARRLPVIAAEDVGPRWLPAVVRVTRTARSAIDLDALDEQLRAITAGLASLPKNKSAYWLAATCWDGRKQADAATPGALRTALRAGDHRAAVAIYIAARDRLIWRSGQRVIDALRESVREGPELAGAIVEAALWREGQGGSGIDELAAAAVIAAIDRPDGPIPDPPSVAHAPPDALRRLDWYAFDGHTVIGERVTGKIARRHGIPPRMLADLMFNCSSILLGPSEEPSRWRDEALELDARSGGWVTHQAGQQLWLRLRDEVRAEIEAETIR
jgi:hypothetical protein